MSSQLTNMCTLSLLDTLQCTRYKENSVLKYSERKHAHTTHELLHARTSHSIATAAAMSARTHNTPCDLEKAVVTIRKSTKEGGHAPALPFQSCPRTAGTATSVGKMNRSSQQQRGHGIEQAKRRGRSNNTNQWRLGYPREKLW